MTTSKVTSALATLVQRIVDGDVEAVDEIGPDADGTQIDPTEVRRDAVAAVLVGLRDGLLEADDVQRWASFVRHGFVTGAAASPDAPIIVDTDPDDAEAITEALDALDGLGDVQDGSLGPDQIDDLLDALSDEP